MRGHGLYFSSPKAEKLNDTMRKIFELNVKNDNSSMLEPASKSFVKEVAVAEPNVFEINNKQVFLFFSFLFFFVVVVVVVCCLFFCKFVFDIDLGYWTCYVWFCLCFVFCVLVLWFCGFVVL